MKLWPAALMVLALTSTGTAADPLEDATYEAVKLCGAVDSINIEFCGDNVVSSPAHSSARKAVIRMHAARVAFMRACQATDRHPSDCPYIAEWHFWRGFNRAVNEEQTATAIK